ncbi:transmembrane protein 109 [Falco biarmicus]|uniref:transmembrane protein 109 n=1 Tax=Falco biarmicus TaxID=345155 RepID=UPI0024BC5101|nr:transmembrane protein 109 [Falco biarmicus]
MAEAGRPALSDCGPLRCRSRLRFLFRFRAARSAAATYPTAHRQEPRWGAPRGAGPCWPRCCGPRSSAGGTGDRLEDGQAGFRAPPAADDLLSRLGRAAWGGLEGWLGPQPLQLLAESLAAAAWVVSSGISVALTTLGTILGDLLAASGLGGDRLVRAAALGPSEVQRVLLWGLTALVASWVLSRLLRLLRPVLRWVKLCCFLGAFLHVAASPESPTVQAGMLLALWVLYALLGCLEGPPSPSPQLDAAVRSLEWKVEELRRRQKWGGPRNREE